MFILANAGLPMLMVGLPFMILLLIPIVAIEATWYRRFLAVSWREAWAGSWKANLWSTFAGIPITWLSLVILEFVLMASVGISSDSKLLAESYVVSYFYFLMTSPWLIPVRDGFGLVIIGAMMVLLLPAYLVSYLGETRVLQKRWPTIDRHKIRRNCWFAHMVTYGLLFLLAWFRLHTLSR